MRKADKVAIRDARSRKRLGEFTEKLESVGFKRGRSNPVAFFRPSDDTSLVVHGNDFTLLGYEDSLEELKTELSKWWEIKVRGTIGDDPGDAKGNRDP